MWMLVEGGVATVAAIATGSIALLGFGVDSLIELASAAVVIWRFGSLRDSVAAAERTAQKLIAVSFATLAAYLTIDGIHALTVDSHARVTWVGGAISAGALIAMPLLAQRKHRVARELDSASMSADATQSWLCALAAAVVLVSAAANAMFGWWWLDSIAGLSIAVLALLEAHDVWRGETCACAAGASLPATAGEPAPGAGARQ
jgi:divalent metal cation (Fe/Co/Zn/Cd) transporter